MKLAWSKDPFILFWQRFWAAFLCIGAVLLPVALWLR